MREFLLFFSFLLVCSYGYAQEVPVEQNKLFLYYTIAVTCLLAISEALALIPSLKSNSVLQLIVNILKAMKGK